MGISDITWKDVGNAVGKAAPLLGGLLGGPAGAAVGGMIASALGTDATPDAVKQAVAVDPQIAVKLAQIEADNRVKLQELVLTAENNRLVAETNQLQSVNKTMQTEAAANDPWVRRWRPYWGFVTGTVFGVVCLGVLILLWMAIHLGDATAMNAIPQVINAMVMLFGIPGAILGIASWHRGVAQVEEVKSGGKAKVG